MGSWTNEGFVAKDINYYTAELQKIFIECFGDDFLLDPALPQGIFITRLAELLYNADMDGIEGYSHLNINTASGVYLDVIGGLRNLPRSLGTAQKIGVRLAVNPKNFIQFSIPKGQTFSSLDGGLLFKTDSTYSITSATTDNIVFLDFSSLGDSGINIGDKLTTSGYGQITNIEVVSIAPGMEEESDIDYRTRILRAVPVANNTIQFVENLLLQDQSVRLVGHNYNDTNETKDTLPAYSTEFMVVPETSVNISDPAAAEAWKTKIACIILNNKVPGTPTAGNTTVTNATDVFGTTKTVNFTIPTKINLEITATLGTPETTGRLDMSGLDDIRDKMEKYINSLAIGSDVSYSRLIAPLAADTGFDVLTFQIKNKDTGTEIQNANFPIGRREYASIVLSDIKLGV
jgi:hypothetical protein